MFEKLRNWWRGQPPGPRYKPPRPLPPRPEPFEPPPAKLWSAPHPPHPPLQPLYIPDCLPGWEEPRFNDPNEPPTLVYVYPDGPSPPPPVMHDLNAIIYNRPTGSKTEIVLAIQFYYEGKWDRIDRVMPDAAAALAAFVEIVRRIKVAIPR